MGWRGSQYLWKTESFFTVVISKFVIQAGLSVSCSGKVTLRLFKDIHKSISWRAKKRKLTGNNVIRLRWFVSH